MELHDDCKRREGSQDDVVYHARVIGHPDVIWSGHRARAMISNHARPAGHECLAQKLDQEALESLPSLHVLQHDRRQLKGFCKPTKPSNQPCSTALLTRML